MLLQSITTDKANDKFSKIQLSGQQGILNLLSSDVLSIGSKQITISVSDIIYLSSKKDFMLNS